MATVLAGEVVPEQQVAPVGTEQAPRDVDGAQQPDHDDALGQAATGERCSRLLLGLRGEQGDPLLGQEHTQAASGDDVEGLQ